MENTGIEVYQELTPNPESMKFVTNRHLFANGIWEGSRELNNGRSALAKRLFDLPEVLSVFISQNFVTVTKRKDSDWYEISPGIREAVRQFLMEGGNPVEEEAVAPGNPAAADSPESRISELLDKYVRPAVEMDGGHIAFDSFENGVVKLKMQGSCSGCPSSQITLKNGIEGLLKRMVPEVQSVEALEA